MPKLVWSKELRGFVIKLDLRDWDLEIKPESMLAMPRYAQHNSYRGDQICAAICVEMIGEWRIVCCSCSQPLLGHCVTAQSVRFWSIPDVRLAKAGSD